MRSPIHIGSRSVSFDGATGVTFAVARS